MRMSIIVTWIRGVGIHSIRARNGDWEVPALSQRRDSSILGRKGCAHLWEANGESILGEVSSFDHVN
jgi:hypothetical protein